MLKCCRTPRQLQVDVFLNQGLVGTLLEMAAGADDLPQYCL